MDTVSFFLPTRKGSQRVKNKNIRPFGDFNGSLLENKLNQLIQTKKINEILLSTNDDECVKIAEKFTKKCTRLKIMIRPDKLCLDTTNLEDLIAYVPVITNADHVLWGHVTTPIAGAFEYDNIVSIYLSKLIEGYDSLVSVRKLQNFLLNHEGKIINNTSRLLWPRTQDLEVLYEINHVAFLAKRDVYELKKNRIGEKPILHVMDKLKSLDIDSEEDFMIAEMVWKAPPPPR
jgi:N-acylneuraminate cytidylyltransferase